jgi:hypothetical protein
MKKAMSIKLPERAVRRAVELYDLEKSFTEQPEEVMDEVEQIFKMKGMQWPTPSYRRQMISMKMRRSLKKGFKVIWARGFFLHICC